MIKRSFLTDTTFTALFVLTIYLFAQINERPVAVLDFEANNGVTEAEAKALTDKLRGELLKTGQFKVIGRSQMEQVLKEQGFRQAGYTSSDCAVEMGQLLGVKSIITGSIGKVNQTFIISARIINAGTGEIAKIVDEDMPGKIDDLLTKGMKKVALKLRERVTRERIQRESKETTEKEVKTSLIKENYPFH